MRSETRLVSYRCGLFADLSNRQCKRLSQRCGVGWRRWTYGPPYIPRYFWRVRGWAVRPSFVHQMEEDASCGYRKSHPAGADAVMGYPRFGMIDLLKLLGGLLVGLFRSRAAREAEMAFLRQQLVVLQRSAPARLR